MSIRFVVLFPDGELPLSARVDAPFVTIGRGSGTDVSLPSVSVSQRHATLRVEGDRFLLADEGSKNGTWVKGDRLLPNVAVSVDDGEIVRLGDLTIRLHLEKGALLPIEAFSTRTLALAMIARDLPTRRPMDAPRVRVVAGPDRDRVFSVAEGGDGVIVGRDPRAHFVVRDTEASRRHVAIRCRAGGVLHLENLGSRNGCAVDGVPLPTGIEVPWPPRGELRFGQNVFAYEHALIDALERRQQGDDVAQEGTRAPGPTAEACGDAGGDAHDVPLTATTPPARAAQVAQEAPQGANSATSTRVPDGGVRRVPGVRDAWIVTIASVCSVVMAIVGIWLLQP